MTKPLKAFTILEALLSLMILSIIVSLSYLMFSLFNKQMVILEKENAVVLQYNLFNSTIKSDINKANDFRVDNEVLTLKNYDEPEIMYRFNKTNILRQKKETVDTFKILTSAYKYENIGAAINAEKMTLNLEVLNDKIVSHYFLNKSGAETINKKYFNED